MNWYYRTLLSYAPMMFVVVSALIFTTFAALSGSSKAKYIETNEAILGQLVQYTDENLQLIERVAVGEMFKDETLRRFFDDAPKTVYDYFVIRKRLDEISSTFPFPLGIYLYDDSTRTFLTQSNVYRPDTFADLAYFDAAYEANARTGWTNPRAYRASDMDKEERVVSMLHIYPYVSDRQGAVIVNVDAEAIVRFLNEMMPGGQGIVRMLDSDERPFREADAASEGGRIAAVSGYTGWRFEIDGAYADEYTVLSVVSNVWIVLGVVVIAVAIVWLTVMTHIRYKPIRTMAGKLGDYAARKREELGVKPAGDELKFIESAIDHLLEKAVDYEQTQQEEQRLRQRHLFHELLAGHLVVTDAEWAQQMRDFGLPHDYERLLAVVLEIDRYAGFAEKYGPSDQYLLKYILETAFRELAQQRDIFVWHAWIRPHRLAAALHLRGRAGTGTEEAAKLCEEFRRWVGANLELTVTAGIGDETDSIRTIAQSSRTAGEHASYKAVFGTDVVIDRRLSETKSRTMRTDWYEQAAELAQDIRLGSPDWEAKCDAIFAGLKQTLLSQAELSGVLNRLIQQLQKATHTRSSGIRMLWTDGYRDRLAKLEGRTETVDELHAGAKTVIAELAAAIEAERIRRDHHAVAVQIKAYIDRHYDDPSLSLNQVADRFGLTPRAVSSLFKEELGEKFIDYLLGVRFHHAKRMLAETEEPIQRIAERVGYQHVISFHRAFKKAFDLPPGEYRNMHRLGRE